MQKAELGRQAVALGVAQATAASAQAQMGGLERELKEERARLDAFRATMAQVSISSCHVSCHVS